MAKRKPDKPTVEDIRKFDNVPVEVAAKFCGTSSKTLYEGLRYQLCPFGWAVKNPETESWAYLIPPERLIRYQNGEMTDYKLEQIIRLAADGVDQVVKAHLANAQRIIGALSL